MFLKKITQKSGRTKLCVYESYREGARTRQRTVRALGYADELAAEHDDPVAWAESVVEEMNAEREAERQSAQVEIHPMQLVDKRAANRRNAGCAAALAVYSGLGIEAVLRNRSRGRAFSFDLSAVMRLLVVERIRSPGPRGPPGRGGAATSSAATCRSTTPAGAWTSWRRPGTRWSRP